MSAVALAIRPALKSVKSLRGEAACVRALLDELDRLAPSSLDEEAVSAQLVEDLARLGCRFLDAACALSVAVDEPTSGTRLKMELVR